jgi:RNAse (barnase) inhibitor barstar/IS5 family transposase
MKKPASPMRSNHTTLKQICQYIPGRLVPDLAAAHAVKARSFSPWSHVVSMLYAHLSHAMGLNDVSDGLRNQRGKLVTLRGATPPSRNGLSHANRTRPAKMAEELFWLVLRHLESLAPGFGGRTYRGCPRRFKRAIRVVDSTTIALVANCMDWAKHRRRKAAAKLHLRLDLQSFLPHFAIVDTAKHNDARRARELCAGLKEGEIVVFDKAYVDFEHLDDLDEGGVIWVTRAKDNMDVRCLKRRVKKPQGDIVRDDEVVLKGLMSRKKYPKRFRRITAWVEINGEEQLMSFITNHMKWAPNSICDLYKCRWSIEAFFKQIKQTLQLSDFLGHNKNAIQWQVWTALLTYLLLRFLEFTSQWKNSFVRIFTVLRGVLWSRFDLNALLESYGTARGSFRMLSAPQQAFLPSFEAICGTAHG